MDEQQEFDAALTECAAAELALRLLLADELQGDLSYSEEQIAKRNR